MLEAAAERVQPIRAGGCDLTAILASRDAACSKVSQ